MKNQAKQQTKKYTHTSRKKQEKKGKNFRDEMENQDRQLTKNTHIQAGKNRKKKEKISVMKWKIKIGNEQRNKHTYNLSNIYTHTHTHIFRKIQA